MSERKCANCGWWNANLEKPEIEEGSYPCNNPQIGGETGGNDGTECPGFLGSDSQEANVPDHIAYGMEKGGTIMLEPNEAKPIDGPCEIFIVTYWKDFPWLIYTLKSIAKFCTGFSGVTIAIPDRDLGEFTIAAVKAGLKYQDFRLVAFREVEGKGMVHHMAIMASADLYVPKGTKYVLHHDADGIFFMPTRPDHYFAEGKPFWLIRTWASLGVEDRRHPVARVRSDCGQWKPHTDEQLGWDTEWYTMCVNTQAIPVEFYPKYRQHIEDRHKKSTVDYYTEPSARNEFPQNRMDWTAFGAFAHRFMPSDFTWFDVESGKPFPADRKKAYWSHGGIGDETRKEIEGFLK